ncbi:LutC/YkgG family protein [Texcoconibacillus texcoconensis]|uniref:Lactate utilization protein C n=1 Tax=Texcoconibacillus texcoconensis TaxID=1095777 RepID=A0A840QP96_9BACI|nr:lactate utilization protein C [Texcoconibacillus texcoconensis]MBB5173189.1 L-lactate dehydrogenase complex protein LldG [Texcoconibacillus texcoconensis]
MSQGTIQNRDRFLKNVADRLGRKRKTEGVTRPKWSVTPQYDVLAEASQDELMHALIEQCGNIHTNVHVTKKDTLVETFRQTIEELGAGSVVKWDDERFAKYGLSEALNAKEEGLHVHTWNPSLKEENIKIAERANIGVTFADMALAESGTVVLFSDEGKGRSVSLLPQTYIGIIPKSAIVPRMTQATEKVHQMVDGGKDVPTCVNFISGPSNSADIELRLVVGVHGPVKATYIIIEDE